MRPTRVEINLDNIAYNISEIQRRIGDKVKIMAVVKANAYGHGAVEVAGSQDGAQLSADEVASKIGTINYEVLCGIDRRVPRVYIKGDKS